MLTPNRVGINPIPGNIFFSQDMDTNYQVGLVWERTPQFRFIYHASKAAAFGISLENANQYIRRRERLVRHRRYYSANLSGTNPFVTTQFDNGCQQQRHEHSQPLPGSHRQGRVRSHGDEARLSL